MNRLWIALRSIFYATLFLTLWTWIALACRSLDKYAPVRMPDGLKPLGAGLVVVGVCLCLTTVGFFIFEGRGTPAVFDPPKKFVPHGPYRMMRNPMYFGYFVVLVGLGLRFTSTGMILFAAVALLVMHSFVVFAEEPGLRKRFGGEYQDYCLRVPRWAPRFTVPHPRR